MLRLQCAPLSLHPHTGSHNPTRTCAPRKLTMKSVRFPCLWLQGVDDSMVIRDISSDLGLGIGPQEVGVLTMITVLTVAISSVSGWLGTRCLPFSAPNYFLSTLATCCQRKTLNCLIFEALLSERFKTLIDWCLYAH